VEGWGRGADGYVSVAGWGDGGGEGLGLVDAGGVQGVRASEMYSV